MRRVSVLFILCEAFFIFLAFCYSKFGTAETWKMVSFGEMFCLFLAICLCPIAFGSCMETNDKYSIATTCLATLGILAYILLRGAFPSSNETGIKDLPFLKMKSLFYLEALSLLPIGILSYMKKEHKDWKFFRIQYVISTCALMLTLLMHYLEPLIASKQFYSLFTVLIFYGVPAMGATYYRISETVVSQQEIVQQE